MLARAAGDSHSRRYSFDYLVGNREQRGRNSQVEGVRSPNADNQLEFRRRLNRKLARLLTPKDTIDVLRNLLERDADVGSVGQQAAGNNPFPEGADGGPLVFGRQCEDRIAMDSGINTRKHYQAGV